MRDCPALMPLHSGIVYGPVRSRRLGHSLGINILPPGRKVCSFNCVYCQYGWTEHLRPSIRPDYAWPSPSDIAAAAHEALSELDRRNAPIDRLTLAGHGEPTLHPRFAEVVDALRDVRDADAPGVALAVLSNSTTADCPAIAAALDRLDERYMKLDAGDQDTLRHVNVCDVPIDRIVDALSALRDVVVQTLLISDASGRITNTTLRALDAWLRALVRIQPEAVHLYTVSRATAWAGVQRVPVQVLQSVARQVRRLGLKALVFP